MRIPRSTAIAGAHLVERASRPFARVSGSDLREGRSFHFSFHTLLPFLLCLGALSCARPRPPVKARPLPPPVQPSPSATEVRAVWVSDTTKLDWETATRELQRAGFNTMYVNFASAGAALYPASLVLPSVAGRTDGDPVARGIELAHRRGIAVQAKIVVMFAFRSPAEFQAKLVKTDRAMRGIDGKPILQSGSVWICPSHPANRHAALAALAELLHRYPVDGLQFDYLRYNEEPSCFCKHCRESFEHALGKPVRHWPADVLNGEFTKRFNDWRQSVINDWARQLSATARQARPGLKITAAVFPALERAREEKAQDWRLWLERGYVDAICPMNYTTNAHDFEERCRGVLKYAPRDRVVMGVAEWKFQQLDELNRQVALCRQLGLAGFALFSYDDATVRHFLPALDLH